MTKTHKEIINAALHNYLHNDTELEMDVKDTVVELYEKANVYDRDIQYLHEIQILNPTTSDYGENVARVVQRLEEAWREITTKKWEEIERTDTDE